MSEERRPSAPVRVSGIVHGRDVTGDGAIALHDDGVELQLNGEKPLRVSLEQIEGVRCSGDSLSLFLRDGDVIDVDAASPDATARELLQRACALPELTRGLRALGSRRGATSPTQQRFFEPLMAVRRRAEVNPGVPGPPGEAMRVQRELRALLAEIAATRWPGRAPDRRALTEELADAGEALWRRLDALATAERALESAPDDTRLARWRTWAAALADAFAEADRCWLTLAPVLERAGEPRRPLWRRLLKLSVITSCMLAARESRAQGTSDQHVTVRVRAAAPSALAARLDALGLDVVAVRDGDVYVVVDPRQRQRLALEGLEISDVPTPAVVRGRAGVLAATTTVYRSYDDPTRGVKAFLDSLRSVTPLARLDTIGFTLEHRPIIAVKIGFANDAPDRPNVLYMATYHAREWAATEMALRLLRYLADAAAHPGKNLRADTLIARRDVWIIPVANPDGYEYTFSTDRLWRKNRRPNPDGSFGVDLNRNHSVHWGFDDFGSSPTPWTEVYRGPSAASELEIQAIEQFHAKHPPVASISYHTFTGLVLYPPGHLYGALPADLGVFRALAGTDVHPSVREMLPAAGRDHYRPAPAWNLYATNGEYTDFAYATHGTIAFTPELTTGFENKVYYGFEFPDDEVRLEQLFQENLPFALDVLEQAGDPSHAHGVASGLKVEPVAVEAVTPQLVLRVPANAPTTATAGQSVHLTPTEIGRYEKRLAGDPMSLPGRIMVDAGATRSSFLVLGGSDADRPDGGWRPSGTTADTTGLSGKAWKMTGTLRSPSLVVPQSSDTVTIVYYTHYEGDGFDLAPHGEVRVSRDDGATWTLEGMVAGFGPNWYPEQVVVTGVAGRTLRVEFATVGLQWTVDDIAVLAHEGARAVPPPLATLTPSENPVRHDVVFFEWPPAYGAGTLSIYDFAGRLVYRAAVAAGAERARWNLAESNVRSGTYLAVAQSRAGTTRQRVFILRPTGA